MLPSLLEPVLAARFGELGQGAGRESAGGCDALFLGRRLALGEELVRGLFGGCGVKSGGAGSLILVFLYRLVLLMLWMIRMWFLRMWIIQMWIIDIWLTAAVAASRVCQHRREGRRVKANRDMLQAILPSIREDAIEMTPERAIRSAFAVHLQHPVALDSNTLQMGPGGREGVDSRDPGARADRAVAGKGPRRGTPTPKASALPGFYL